jgi:alpha-glucosidase
VLLLTLPGTPFLYAGEELGLEDASVPPDRRVDPGGRDGCRAPIPWDASPLHGWAADPWLPWPPEAAARSLATLRADHGSILHLYRRLLSARRGSAALQVGEWIDRDTPDGVLAYERVAGADRRLVLVNFTREAKAVPVSGRVVVASDGASEGGAFPGLLAPDTAVVLAPG